MKHLETTACCPPPRPVSDDAGAPDEINIEAVGSSNMDANRLRTLRVAFVVFVLGTVGLFLLDGRPVWVSVVGRGTLGGLSFVIEAGMLFLYWGWQSTVEP